MTQTKLVSVSEVSSHKSSSDCWIVVDNQVWDITQFAPEHPGGPEIVYKYAGRDASAAYSSIHSPSLIKDNLPASCLKGAIDTSTITEDWIKPPPQESITAASSSKASDKPSLDSLINAQDFEIAAEATSTKKTWAFYSSADTDLVTRHANRSFWDRIWLRPRTMRNVTTVDTTSTILGLPVSLPLMVSAASMARLIHADGELAIARACAEKNIIQCISTSASYSATEIASSAPNHPFFFQLYVDRQRHKSEALLRKVQQQKNVKAIFVTVDAAAAGKREADERVKADESLQTPMANSKATNDKKGGGYGRVMGGFIDPGLCWDDIKWLRSQTTLPLVLKGVMTADDVKLALDHGLEGVLLSNHGGRNLDTAPPALLVLLECNRRFPEVFQPDKQGKRMEIYVDGGIRRGTSILKALCLGATGVGIGRSFLFATSYGQEGVEHLIDILKDELEVAMRNCGITRIEDAGPELVNTGDLDHLIMTEREHPYVKNWRRGPREGRAKL